MGDRESRDDLERRDESAVDDVVARDEAEASAPDESTEPGPRESTAKRVFCVVCGAEMERGDMFCHACGWDSRATPKAPPPRLVDPNPSPHNRLTTLLLCVILGFFGLHRFYVGKIGTGLIWLFTLGFFSVGLFFDLVLIATGEFRDADGRRVLRWSDAQVGSAPSP